MSSEKHHVKLKLTPPDGSKTTIEANVPQAIAHILFQVAMFQSMGPGPETHKLFKQLLLSVETDLERGGAPMNESLVVVSRDPEPEDPNYDDVPF